MAGKPWLTNPLDLIAGPGSPRKTRLAFLEEGSDPLGAVLRLEDVVAQLQSQPDGFLATRVQRLPHAAFDRRHGLLRPAGDASGDVEGARERLPVGNNLVDQSQTLCFARVDGLAEVHELHGPRGADQLGEAEQAAAPGHHAEPYFGERELCALARDP